MKPVVYHTLFKQLIKQLLFLLTFFAFTYATPFEVFYSQFEVASPCTGSIITFDHGKLEMELVQIYDTTFDVSVEIFTTLRHEDVLDTHQKKNKFAAKITDSLALRVNGKDISYILKLGMIKTDGKVVAVSLSDIEIAYCRSE